MMQPVLAQHPQMSGSWFVVVREPSRMTCRIHNERCSRGTSPTALPQLGVPCLQAAVATFAPIAVIDSFEMNARRMGAGRSEHGARRSSQGSGATSAIVKIAWVAAFYPFTSGSVYKAFVRQFSLGLPYGLLPASNDFQPASATQRLGHAGSQWFHSMTVARSAVCRQ